MGYLLFQLVKLSENEDYYIKDMQINETDLVGVAVLQDNWLNYHCFEYNKENENWDLKEVIDYVH